MGLFPSLIYVPLYLVWHLIVIMNYSFMAGLRNSFEIRKHVLTLCLVSLLVSYTISLINKRNSRTFPCLLVIEAENAFWLPLRCFKKENQDVSIWFWLLWARLWHFRLFTCESHQSINSTTGCKAKRCRNFICPEALEGCIESFIYFPCMIYRDL